jgi:hypothetical protein
VAAEVFVWHVGQQIRRVDGCHKPQIILRYVHLFIYPKFDGAEMETSFLCCVFFLFFFSSFSSSNALSRRLIPFWHSFGTYLDNVGPRVDPDRHYDERVRGFDLRRPEEPFDIHVDWMDKFRKRLRLIKQVEASTKSILSFSANKYVDDRFANFFFVFLGQANSVF